MEDRNFIECAAQNVVESCTNYQQAVGYTRCLLNLSLIKHECVYYSVLQIVKEVYSDDCERCL